MRWIPYLLIGAVAAVGCNTAENALGRNSEVRVAITSIDTEEIRQVTFLIAPREGAIDDPNACRPTDWSFCTKVTKHAATGSMLAEFRSLSFASDKPYQLYVVNGAAANKRFRVRIFMDDKEKYNRVHTFTPGQSSRVAKIFRTSVGGVL